MPNYFIERGQHILLPHGELRIRPEGTGGNFRISVVGPDRSEIRTARLHQGRVVVSEVDAPSIVAAFPGDGAAVFRDGTAVTLFIEADSGLDWDPLEVHVVRQDVSGLYRAELARLRPAGNQIEISVRLPEELGPLAQAAFDTANEMLGRDRTPAISATDIGIAVDTTASMAPRIGDGSVTALTDIVAGVCRAAACDLRSVHVLGPTPLVVPVAPIGELGERVGSALRKTGVGIGFEARNIPPREDRHVVFVITDTPPIEKAADRRGIRPLILDPGSPVSPGAGGTSINPGHLTALSVTDDTGPLLRTVVRQLLAELTTEEEEPSL